MGHGSKEAAGHHILLLSAGWNVKPRELEEQVRRSRARGPVFRHRAVVAACLAGRAARLERWAICIEPERT